MLIKEANMVTLMVQMIKAFINYESFIADQFKYCEENNNCLNLKKGKQQ